MLSMSNYPQSYRYYDSVFQIVKRRFKRQSLEEIHRPSLLQRISNFFFDGTDRNVSHGHLHTCVQHDLNQIQYSKFLKVDSELNKLDELSADVHLKYIHAEDLKKIKYEYLSYKAKFGQQMQHLKAKGSMLHILQRADREIVGRLEDFLVQEHHVFHEEERARMKRAVTQDKIQEVVAASSGFGRHQQLQQSQTLLKPRHLHDAIDGQREAKVEQKLRLMTTLKRQFESEYLHKANDNYYFALKKQTAQVESCVYDIMKQKYEAKRSQSMAAARKYLCDRYRPFGAKEDVVDTGIEGDIRFFNHNYTAR